jgi:hypothetical protein
VPPFGDPFGAAAAALSGASPEAGGTGLVWAILALLVLIPAMGDRWLRLARGISPRAPFVALDGAPG